MKDSEQQNIDNGKELIKIGVAVGFGTAAICGAALYMLGYSKGAKQMTPDEQIIRATLMAAKIDGEAPIHWVTGGGKGLKYLVKFIGEDLK
jgi:hypothetical protein